MSCFNLRRKLNPWHFSHTPSENAYRRGVLTAMEILRDVDETLMSQCVSDHEGGGRSVRNPDFCSSLAM